MVRFDGRRESERRGDAHDRAHGSDNLGEDGRRHGFGVDHGVRSESKSSHRLTVSSDVSWNEGQRGRQRLEIIKQVR